MYVAFRDTFLPEVLTQRTRLQQRRRARQTRLREKPAEAACAFLQRAMGTKWQGASTPVHQVVDVLYARRLLSADAQRVYEQVEREWNEYRLSLMASHPSFLQHQYDAAYSNNVFAHATLANLTSNPLWYRRHGKAAVPGPTLLCQLRDAAEHTTTLQDADVDVDESKDEHLDGVAHELDTEWHAVQVDWHTAQQRATRAATWLADFTRTLDIDALQLVAEETHARLVDEGTSSSVNETLRGVSRRMAEHIIAFIDVMQRIIPIDHDTPIDADLWRRDVIERLDRHRTALGLDLPGGGDILTDLNDRFEHTRQVWLRSEFVVRCQARVAVFTQRVLEHVAAAREMWTQRAPGVPALVGVDQVMTQLHGVAESDRSVWLDQLVVEPPSLEDRAYVADQLERVWQREALRFEDDLLVMVRNTIMAGGNDGRLRRGQVHQHLQHMRASLASEQWSLPPDSFARRLIEHDTHLLQRMNLVALKTDADGVTFVSGIQAYRDFLVDQAVPVLRSLTAQVLALRPKVPRDLRSSTRMLEWRVERETWHTLRPFVVEAHTRLLGSASLDPQLIAPATQLLQTDASPTCVSIVRAVFGLLRLELASA